MRRDQQKKLLSLIRSFKEQGECLVCKEDDPCCLEFHHVDPKRKWGSPAQLVREGINKNIVLQEIDKCVLLCSNCHKKAHAGRIDMEEYTDKAKKEVKIRKREASRLTLPYTTI